MNRNSYSILVRIIGYSAVAIALYGCAQSQRAPDVMSIGWCDTTPMKAVGRPARVPDARIVSGFGTLTGVVVQRETGDALQSALVRLVSAPGRAGQSQPERPTDSNGGFTFDSVVPGHYQLRVRALGEYQDSLRIQAVAERVDTARFGLRAYRCYGY
jgi:hypothetical protein